jgi:hypothetical protein
MSPLLAFVHIQKTAGITITHILRRNYGTAHADVHPLSLGQPFFSAQDLRWTQRLYPRLKSIAGHLVRPLSDLRQVDPDVFYYTFMREPIERCASHYQYMIQEMGRTTPFEEWIEEFKDFQTKKIAGVADANAAFKTIFQTKMFVGMVERFNESLLLLWRQIFSLTGRNLNIYYIRKNVAPRNQIKLNLMNTPETRNLLEQANIQDVKLYNLVKEKIYPDQQELYGATLSKDIIKFEHQKARWNFERRYFFGFMKRNLLYKPALKFYRTSSRLFRKER